MIATPIARWMAGDGALVPMMSVGVLVQLAAVSVIQVRADGAGPTLRLGLTVAAAAWLAELVGSRTGFPFGSYSYSPMLQPQLGGVPLLVPLAWLMMLPPSWAVAQAIVGPRTLDRGSRLLRAALAALAFTAWDLFLDPQMAGWGFWTWPEGGPFFGVPLTNYLGWLLVSFLMGLFLIPDRLPVLPLLIIYGVTWFLQSFGQAFFWGLPGPALCGFLGMGGMFAWAALRRRT